jgi:hypothetical protein
VTHGAPGSSGAARPPLLLLLIPPAILLLAAAATPTSALFTDQGDVGLYYRRVTDLASGLLPYRDVPFEYPPLALVPMLVPALLWPFGELTLETYKWLFAGWGAGLMVVLGLVLGRIVRIRALSDANAAVIGRAIGRQQIWLGIRLGLLTAGAALALAWRFDLFPALLTAVALWVALERRPALTGAAIAAGVLTKLYPIILAPALAVPWLMPAEGRGLRRLVGALAVTAAVVVSPLVMMAGPATFGFLAYQALRGLQIESLGGGLVLLGGLLRGEPIPIVAPFLAAEVTGPLAEAWLLTLPVVTALGFALVGWLGWHRMRRDVAALGRVTARSTIALATASLLVLLVTSKVFSIQYVVWLVPFAALMGGLRFWLAAAMVALTMPIHPLLYDELVAQEALPVLILNVRNALLVALTVWVLFDLRGAAAGERAA